MSANAGQYFQYKRAGSGRSSRVVRFTTAADTTDGVRLTVIGGADGADLDLRGDLGLNPVIRTLRGDDRWLITGAQWQGKLRGITSTGDDEVRLLDPSAAAPLLFTVNLGGGDDEIVIDAGFDSASRANGTGGQDLACDLSGVLPGTFETVKLEGCE